MRYKTNLQAFTGGLSIINRLRPVTFTWKDGGMRDLGFAAEDVEKIDPLLVTYNKQGRVEGVKYDRINVAMVNAIKELQKQIEELNSIKSENAELKARLAEVFKRLEQIETSPWVKGAPDLVVEIGSPSTRRRDETIKRRLYERFGVGEYWVVDPELETIKVYRRTGDRYERVAELFLEHDDRLTSPLFPDLELALSEIFED